MISRSEKNKKYVNELNKEKRIKVSKILFKIIGTIIIIFTLCFLYIYYLGPKGLKTHEYVIFNSNIPDNFNGIKALHFSDLLYGSTINNDDLEKITSEINLINPDIVFFTGNIVSDNYELGEEEIKTLNDFFKSIPYTIGKYAVTGDLDSSTFDLIMEDTYFTILDNELKEVYNEKDKINVLGINTKEVKELKTNDIFTITLINNYDDYDKYNITSNIVLAGYNLGGEIRFFNIPLIKTSNYLNNYYENGNTKIYISNGLGTRHHMRLMNKPSLNVYRLYNN